MAVVPVEVTAPSAEPVTVATVKTHIGITTSDWDTFLTDAIVKARRYLYGPTGVIGRTLITTTYRLSLDEWPDIIVVPRPPLQSVTSIKYVDLDGAQQTWAASKYQVDTDSMPGRIQPAYNEEYPTIRTQLNAVEVLYVAGYGDNATDVPDEDIHNIIQLVSLWFRYREPIDERGAKSVQFALESMIWQDRIIGF